MQVPHRRKGACFAQHSVVEADGAPLIAASCLHEWSCKSSFSWGSSSTYPLVCFVRPPGMGTENYADTKTKYTQASLVELIKSGCARKSTTDWGGNIVQQNGLEISAASTFSFPSRVALKSSTDRMCCTYQPEATAGSLSLPRLVVLSGKGDYEREAFCPRGPGSRLRIDREDTRGWLYCTAQWNARVRKARHGPPMHRLAGQFRP